MSSRRKFLNLKKMLRPKNEVLGRNKFLQIFKSDMRKFDGLVVPSDIDLREFLQDLTVMTYNIAFNGSITEADLDPHYNRRPYCVNWDLTRYHRFIY
jgi:hypothetical protein